MREFFFARVPRDECEETGGAAVVFGTQDSSESLGFFLARTERAGNLNENVGLGQVDSEVPNFGQNDASQCTGAETIVNLVALRLRRLSGNQREIEFSGNSLDLGKIFADDQNARARMILDELAQTRR